MEREKYTGPHRGYFPDCRSRATGGALEQFLLLLWAFRSRVYQSGIRLGKQPDAGTSQFSGWKYGFRDGGEHLSPRFGLDGSGCEGPPGCMNLILPFLSPTV